MLNNQGSPEWVAGSLRCSGDEASGGLVRGWDSGTRDQSQERDWAVGQARGGETDGNEAIEIDGNKTVEIDGE